MGTLEFHDLYLFLKRIEYSGRYPNQDGYGVHVCPVCLNVDPTDKRKSSLMIAEGHTKDCELGHWLTTIRTKFPADAL